MCKYNLETVCTKNMRTETLIVSFDLKNLWYLSISAKQQETCHCHNTYRLQVYICVMHVKSCFGRWAVCLCACVCVCVCVCVWMWGWEMMSDRIRRSPLSLWTKPLHQLKYGAYELLLSPHYCQWRCRGLSFFHSKTKKLTPCWASLRGVHSSSHLPLPLRPLGDAQPLLASSHVRFHHSHLPPISLISFPSLRGSS